MTPRGMRYGIAVGMPWYGLSAAGGRARTDWRTGQMPPEAAETACRRLAAQREALCQPMMPSDAMSRQ